jgi:AraC-like DNA-binding protein
MLDKYLSNISVEVEPFALCLLDSGWRLTLPGPPVAMLHFVVQGEGWVISPDGRRRPIGANHLAVIPVGAVHSLETSGAIEQHLTIDCAPSGPPVHRIVAGKDGPLDMVVGCGTLRVRYGEAMGLFDHLSEVLVVDLSGITEVPMLFQGILAEQSHLTPGGTVLQGAMMTQLIVHMFRKLSEDSDYVLPWLGALDDPRLGRAIDRVMADPSAHHTVESLAEVANMSRSAFAEHFSAAFGRSPINFVNHVRMEQAARLLNTGRLPVDKVAERVGFSSRSHFSQAFKKHTGQSPAEYRRS